MKRHSICTLSRTAANKHGKTSAKSIQSTQQKIRAMRNTISTMRFRHAGTNSIASDRSMNSISDRRRQVTAIAIFWMFACTANGQVPVYVQESRAIGNPASSSIAIASVQTDDPFEPRAKAFDNFTLSTDVDLTGIEWRGAYNNVFNPNPDFRGTIDFEVWIYSNNANNSPNVNDVLFTGLFDAGDSGIDNGTEVSKMIVPNTSHRTGGVITDYELEFDPVSLSAGTYWLSVVGNQTLPSPHPDDFPADPNKHFDPTWSWVTANSGDNLAYQFDQRFDPFEPGFRLTSSCPGRCDTTFTLLGDPPASGIPGDYDGNSILTAVDLDILAEGIRDGSQNEIFDTNIDGTVSHADFDFWVAELFGTLLGDANLNREVEIEDFLSLSRRFSQPGGWQSGDFNGDGVILFDDFVLFARNYGLSRNMDTAFAAVPEPSGLKLLISFAFFVPIVRFVKRIGKSVDVTVVAVTL